MFGTLPEAQRNAIKQFCLDKKKETILPAMKQAVLPTQDDVKTKELQRRLAHTSRIVTKEKKRQRPQGMKKEKPAGRVTLICDHQDNKEQRLVGSQVRQRGHLPGRSSAQRRTWT